MLKTKQIILVIVSFFIVNISNSQNITITKDKTPLKEKTRVEVNIIGEINGFVYTYTTKLDGSGLRLCKYNKTSTNLVKNLPVSKFGAKLQNDLLTNSKITNIFISNSTIYVAWTHTSGNNFALVLQTFDENLSSLIKPKILYQFNGKNGRMSAPHFFVQISPDGNKLICGVEESSKKGEQLKIQYKLFNSEFDILTTVQAELPYTVNSTISSASAEYKVDNLGFVYFQSQINLVENKKSKNINRGFVVGSLNPNNNELSYQIINFDTKEVKNLTYEILPNYIAIYGIYNERANNTITAGVYTAKLDKTSLNIIGDPVFSEIEAKHIVYTEFKAEKTKSRTLSSEEVTSAYLGRDFAIIGQYATSDGGIVFQLADVEYWTTCTNNSCTYSTKYYNVYHIKVSNEGKVDWLVCVNNYSNRLNWHEPKIGMNTINGKLQFIVYNSNSEGTFYEINEATGKTIKKKLEANKLENFTAVIDNEFMLISRKSHISTAGLISTGALLAAGGISYYVYKNKENPTDLDGILKFFLPFGFIASTVYTITIKSHDIYFGKIVIK